MIAWFAIFLFKFMPIKNYDVDNEPKKIMKPALKIIIVLLFASCTVSAQSVFDSVRNEFCFSINKTEFVNSNSESRYGFGFGVYNCCKLFKKTELSIGLEYNRTNQFKKSENVGTYAWDENLSYHLNNISFPLSARYNFNIKKNIKLFIEAGIFADFNISSKRTGLKQVYYPDENNQLHYYEFNIDENAGLVNINFGIPFGFGISMPINNYLLIIKPEFKLGLTDLHNFDDSFDNKYIRILIGMSLP